MSEYLNIIYTRSNIFRKLMFSRLRIFMKEYREFITRGNKPTDDNNYITESGTQYYFDYLYSMPQVVDGELLSFEISKPYDGRPYDTRIDLFKIEHDRDEECAFIQFHGLTYEMDEELWFIGVRNNFDKILMYTAWPRKIVLPY